MRENAGLRLMLGVIRHVFKALGYGFMGACVVFVVIFVIHLDSRPDLKVWHEAELDAEFKVSGPIKTFADYLSLEKQLFNQLDERVYDRIQPVDRRQINRYHRGSLSDPGRWSLNWNRTFELAASAPAAGILLLHGMSDSPYSLRSLGQRLHAAGAWVVGLRLPGHGTAPSGLVRMRWEDMAAAVRMAMNHLRDQLDNRPLYIVGYSNGGTLAVHYALTALKDPTLPKVSGLILISPAIGVTPLAALARWQARIGRLLGLGKLAWNSIIPEYDPFKYGSFAVNAGDQTYRLTGEIKSHLKTLGAAGELKAFPAVLAFQSIVDATVSTEAVVQELFEKLPAGRNELVLFDINRLAKIKRVLAKDPGMLVKALFDNTHLPFTVGLVTNKNEESRDIVLRQKKPGKSKITEIPLSLAWPRGLYSLSHVALPFPPDDPIYGGSDSGSSPGIHLGSVAMRGERGVLRIPSADMLRLRWNPFYAYIEKRLLDFFHLEASSSSSLVE